MATLQELQKELAQKRGEHAVRFEAIKTAPAEQRPGLIEEIKRAEADLEKLHNQVIQEQEVVELEKRNQDQLKSLRTPVPTVPFSVKDGDGNGSMKAYGGDDGPNFEGRNNTKSIGYQLTNEEKMRSQMEYVKARVSGRSVELDFPFRSPAEWKAAVAREEYEAKATFSDTGLTGYDRVPGVITRGTETPRVADLLARGETTQNTVRYVQETAAFTNYAAFVAENGLKPEATFDLEEADAAVRKIAVIARVSDEMFADFPATRDYINQRLPLMVELAEDSALLNGTGTAPQIRGILQTSGILSGGTHNQGADTTADPIPNVVMRSMVQIQAVSHFEPDGVVMNPLDFQNVALMRATDGTNYGQYIWGHPSLPGPRTIWGLPVVLTTAIADNTLLVGAFRLGAQVFRRQGITIEMTNADGNDFQYNRIAIRCETRLALAVYRPTAFAKSTLQ